MRADEEDAFFVGRGKTVGATAVELRRGQRQAEEDAGAPVGTAFEVFTSVVVRGKKF